MTDRVSSARFIGRREKLARLEEAFAAAEGGAPGAVFVGGEAGIGKTRLVSELQAGAVRRGAMVLAGGCIQLSGGDLPYGPIVEALRGLPQSLPDTVVRELLGPADQELARLVANADPAQLESRGPSRGSATRARLLESVLDLLAQLGEMAPVVLVVEDVHWADRSTLDVLTFLARNLRRERVLVVATYRTDELLGRHPLRALLAELDRSGRAVRMELASFERDEVAALLGGILGGVPPDDLVERVFLRSGGNAFFAEELLAAGLGERGTRVPPKLRDVLMVRIEALSEDAQETLRVVAAAGRRVPHRLVATVSQLPDSTLLPALREAAIHHVLLARPDEDVYSFRHELAREVVYADLLPGERIRLHAAIAHALVEDLKLVRSPSAVGAAELARHWLAADQPANALAAVVTAGRAAAEVHAFAEAQQQFERALDLWDRVPDAERKAAALDHGELLARAAEAARWNGDPDKALALTHQALQAGPASDPVWAGVLWERLGRYRWEKGDTEGALAAYDEAVRLVGDEPIPALRARIRAAQGSALMVRGRYRESRERCQQAIELARTGGARAEEGIALNILGVDLAMTGDLDAGIRCLTTACSIAEEVGTLEDVCRGYANLSFVYENSGRLEDAVAAARRGLEITRRFGLELTGPGGVLLTNAASQLVLLGRWEEAEGYLSPALDSGDADGLLGAYGFLYRAELRIARGLLDQAREDLDSAQRIAGACALREPQFIGPLHVCLAELAIWAGSYDDAGKAVADGLESTAGDEDHQHAIRLCALGLRAVADEMERARIRRSPEVDALRSAGVQLLVQAHELGHEAGRRGTVLPEVTVVTAVCEAEFSRLESPADPVRWVLVATLWDDLRRPYQAAYARFRQAETLLENRSPRQAAVALYAAWQAALSLQAEPLCQEIKLLAQRGRIDLRDPAPASKKATEPSPAEQLGLTPREREVLQYLVEGQTNRQIARKLFIQEKTASVHVSNILGKFGVANRGEAAAAAHRMRLL